jgi:uncharacterized protein YdhG (YjbR/CyaY superfamily)
VSAAEIDAYLDGLKEPERTSLRALRANLVSLLPDAEQGLSYGLPAFKVRGKTIAGFAAFRHHLAYLPHSGSVFPQLADELAGYETTTGSLHFPVDADLPKPLVAALVRVRLDQAFPG